MIDLASLVLRLGIGGMFMAHGAQKLFGAFGGSGIQGFSQMLSGMGFTSPLFWAYLAVYAELLGGLFLVLGLFVRIATVFLMIVMAVALVKVHISKGFFLSGGGFEYIFIIMIACIAIMLLGAGRFSITKKL